MILKSRRPLRFFYHYYKQKKRMSLHYKGACHVIDNVICHDPCETKWNRRQPNLVMQGFTKQVSIKDGVATIGVPQED